MNIVKLTKLHPEYTQCVNREYICSDDLLRLKFKFNYNNNNEAKIVQDQITNKYKWRCKAKHNNQKPTKGVFIG